MPEGLLLISNSRVAEDDNGMKNEPGLFGGRTFSHPKGIVTNDTMMVRLFKQLKEDHLLESVSLTETTTTTQTEPERKSISIDWAESEWFQVWLQLARHEYPEGREE